MTNEHRDIRPQKGSLERPTYQDSFKTVKEIADMYHVSTWTLYELIKKDPSFPFLNVGIKKRFVIPVRAFENWLYQRSRSEAKALTSELFSWERDV